MICQSSSAIRCILKLTLGDLAMPAYMGLQHVIYNDLVPAPHILGCVAAKCTTQSKLTGTSPNFFSTMASENSPTFGSPVRLNATAPALASSRDIFSARLMAAFSPWHSSARPGALPSSVRMKARRRNRLPTWRLSFRRIHRGRVARLIRPADFYDVPASRLTVSDEFTERIAYAPMRLVSVFFSSSRQRSISTGSLMWISRWWRSAPR